MTTTVAEIRSRARPDCNPSEFELVGDVIADSQRAQQRLGHERRREAVTDLLLERGGSLHLGGGVRMVLVEEKPEPEPRRLTAAERTLVLRGLLGGR